MSFSTASAVLATLATIACTGARSAQPPASAQPLEPSARTYRQVDGKSLRVFVFSPARALRTAPLPAVMLFHGGGWAAGSPEWTFATARRFSTLGLVAIPVEYRLSTDSTTPIDAFADVCAAFQWARRQAPELGLDPNRIAGYGVSAGGHLVALAATVGCGVSEGSLGIGGPDALVLWSPALDLALDNYFMRLLRGRARGADYSPVEHVRQRMPPVSIVHGAKDNLTPLSGSQRFCQQISANGGRCELNVYEGIGHLLTRNLSNQESDFDPDPVARDDGIARQSRFLRELWPR